MSATRLGYVIYAVSCAILGVLSLLSGDFALVWQPVPTWVPGREIIAYASGALLLAGGVGMLVERTAVVATLLMTANAVAWLVLLRLPPLVVHPGRDNL